MFNNCIRFFQERIKTIIDQFFKNFKETREQADWSITVLFNLFVITEPLKHFHVCHRIPEALSCLSWNPHQQKVKKTRVTRKKSKYFIIRDFNKQAVITEVEKQEI